VFQRRFFATGQPLGRTFRVGDAASGTSYEIVGVVRNAQFRDLREETLPMVYFPILQRQSPLGEVTLVARGESDISGAAVALRRTLVDHTPNLAFHMTTMSAQLDASLVRERLLASLAAAFGIMAAVLAAVGLYGVIAHAVISRTAEIGLHMAFGATARRVVWALVRSLAAVIGVATLIGGAAAIALARSIRSLLFDVTPADPVTLMSVAGFVLLVAIIAGVIPAGRATRIDPAVALRHP
jgi:predicted lysophospholipase L1 biosynthesis ABC-type transport system permease subunit